MRIARLVAIIALAVSCTISPSAGAPAPTPSASASTPMPIAGASTPTPGQSPTAGACAPAISYGLLIAGGSLQVIDTCGKVGANAPLGAPSVQTCSLGGGTKANLAPPVSATSDRIFYRDGDTEIGFLTPKGDKGHATTVPGSATTVSFFSVSPDDQRIAVLVEDVSPGTSINLRLYVEDVQGGGHHADIYSTSILKSSGNTLWPMGWHNGQLVLAVIAACNEAPGGVSPVEWHVVDPANANRKATITGSCPSGQSGILSRWPSPSGIACSDFRFRTDFIDWTGTVFSGAIAGENSNDVQTGLSPDGKAFFYGSATAGECGAPPSACITNLVADVRNVYLLVASGPVPCFWIDDAHLLRPDAVLALPPLPLKVFRAQAVVANLSVSGECAGRFPGGL